MPLKTLKYTLLAILFANTVPVLAQDDYVTPEVEHIRKPYKFSDNLFWGWSVGANHSMSSLVLEQGVFKMIRPIMDIHFGKHFTEALGAKMSIGYHMQAGSIGNKTLDKIVENTGIEEVRDKGAIYSIYIGNIAADCLVNMNRVFGSRKQNPKVKFVVYGGCGLNTVFGYSDLTNYWNDFFDFDRSIKFCPEFHAGLQAQFRSSEGSVFTLDGSWHTTNASYNGLSTRTGMRQYVEVSIGVTTRLINQYASREFEYCRGNEKFYFDLSEKQLTKDYRKLFKKHKIEKLPEFFSDSILSFPHTYAYLTPVQTEKIKKMIDYLLQHHARSAVIEVYPHASRSDDMTLEQSVDRCTDEIWQVTCKLWGDENPPLRIIKHNDCYSPIPPTGIWFHNAFIKYEGRAQKEKIEE